MAENGSYEHIFFPFADIFWSMRPMNTNRRALCCPELVDDFRYPYHCHTINTKFSTSVWSWNITSKMQKFAKNDHFWIFNFWKFFPWQFRFFANLLLELKMVEKSIYGLFWHERECVWKLKCSVTCFNTLLEEVDRCEPVQGMRMSSELFS